jgi:hypothetical protein
MCGAAAALLLAGCGGSDGAGSLDCDETRSRQIDVPASLGDDAAAVAAWYLDDRGLAPTDVVEDVPNQDVPTAAVRRDGRVVALVVVDISDRQANVEACADFAA